MSGDHVPEHAEEPSVTETTTNLSTINLTRRSLLQGAAATGVGASTLGLLGRRARAQSTDPVKIGLLEDQSGNIALFAMPKLHAAQLAIQEINDGFTLLSGPTGLGGIGTAEGLMTRRSRALGRQGHHGTPAGVRRARHPVRQSEIPGARPAAGSSTTRST